MSNPSSAPVTRVLVWDIPTRVFHWSLVTLVAIAWATGETRGFWFEVHEFAGYGVLALILFRIAWGIWGSRHSLFSDFVRGFGVVRDYTAKLMRLRPPHSVGHNPLGGWMIVLLLATLVVQVGTGLFAGGEEVEGVTVTGPLASYISPDAAHAFLEIHETAFNILLVLVCIHLAGVITDIVLTRDNLILAMITGRKPVTPDAAAAESGGIAPVWRAVAFAAIAVLVTWAIASY